MAKKTLQNAKMARQKISSSGASKEANKHPVGAYVASHVVGTMGRFGWLSRHMATKCTATTARGTATAAPAGSRALGSPIVTSSCCGCSYSLRCALVVQGDLGVRKAGVCAVAGCCDSGCAVPCCAMLDCTVCGAVWRRGDLQQVVALLK